jgi:signal transduction protein with GAF and PtsI domain
MDGTSDRDWSRLLDDALRAAGCNAGTLHVLDPDTGMLALRAHLGIPPEIAGIVAVVPLGKGMAGLAAERRQPVQTCNLQSDPSSDIRPKAKSVPVQASIALPMIVDGELRGVLGVAKHDAHEWTDAESQSLLELASNVARRF